jgi:hypothetical protein
MKATEDDPKSMDDQISPPALPRASPYLAGDPISAMAVLAPLIPLSDRRRLLNHSFPRGTAAKIGP